MGDTAVIEDRKLVSFNPIRTRRDLLLWLASFVAAIAVLYIMLLSIGGYDDLPHGLSRGGVTGFMTAILIGLIRHQSMTARVPASCQPLLVAALEKVRFRQESAEGARLVFLPKRPSWNRFDAETVVLERVGDRLEISAPRYVMQRFRKALKAG